VKGCSPEVLIGPAAHPAFFDRDFYFLSTLFAVGPAVRRGITELSSSAFLLLLVSGLGTSL